MHMALNYQPPEKDRSIAAQRGASILTIIIGFMIAGAASWESHQAHHVDSLTLFVWLGGVACVIVGTAWWLLTNHLGRK